MNWNSLWEVDGMREFMSGVENIVNFLTTAVSWGFTLYFGFVIVVNIFNWFQKGGDPQKKPEAKEKLIFSTMGLAVTWAAVLLVRILMSLFSGSFGS